MKEVYGDRIACVTIYNVAEGQVKSHLQELVDEGCDYIIAASYGYGPDVKAIAEQYPDIQFCVPTGDNANSDPVLPNYHNCFGEIYQGRYVCGRVAGMKIKQMIEKKYHHPPTGKSRLCGSFSASGSNIRLYCFLSWGTIDGSGSHHDR